MESKLDKYFKKMQLCTNEQKYNFYMSKINYYKKIQDSKQKGGGVKYNLSDNIESQINDIINGKYTLITDTDLIQKINYDPKNCEADFFSGQNEDQVIEYKDGYRLNCFSKIVGVDPDAQIKEQTYIFKKSFSLTLTDIYMQKGLSEDNLRTSTNYVYFLLYNGLNTYLSNIIKAQKYGPNTEFLYKNIYFLYKGGNTTRMILRSFVETSKINLSKVNSEDTNKAIKNLDELISGSNVGDWDYSIKIKYKNLFDKGFTEQQLVDIRKELAQVFLFMATIIKEKIQLLLLSKVNINNTATEIQNVFFDPEINQKIEKFINAYSALGKKKVDSMVLKNIYTFDKVIDGTNIRNMNDDEYQLLYKNSFVFNVAEKKQPLTTKLLTNYVETDTQFVDLENKRFMPMYLKKDMIYIAYLSNIRLFRRYGISSFDLTRIKVNNLLQFDLKIRDLPTPVIKNMFSNIELVDITVPSIYDTRDITYGLYIYPENIANDTIEFKLQNKAFKDEPISIPIPSQYIMFADISTILFIDNLFIWEDPKYKKRIKRLFFLSLPCFYGDGQETKDIVEIFQTVKKLFTELKNLNSSAERLNKLKNDYEIVDNPLNDQMNNVINNYVFQKYKDLKIVNKIIKIKNTSPNYFRYLEFLIANYIKILIVSNYVLFNLVKPYYQDLVHYELSIHRIMELSNFSEYIKPEASIITTGLNDIYKQVRGTGHTLRLNELLPLGPLVVPLANANPDNVEKFMNNLKSYEDTIIESCDYTLTILRGFQSANVTTMDVNYTGDSLY
ncbi:MAG: hypothetical protein Edafosvirus9_34 [Edafosvirus sp.]|uniref:Uncharacterized protein n=1 Tax=Edafosvirus sp. TaxID=2487765 RepID=A0A3G4ZTU0_9VIRU|nr:MAG: hypothetical protein Edafosvirus9_34 [Edafosvirus sp.]